MANDTSIALHVNGINDLKAALAAIPIKLRKKILLGALRKAARVVSRDAKTLAPVLQAPIKYRTKGLVRRKISVRTSKIARKAGDVGVFINVRPAPKGSRGAKNPADPFYWRFLEFGTKKMTARPFLTKAADKLPEALKVFESEVGPQIQKLNTP